MSLYKPFDYQIEAIDAIFNYFNSGKKGNPLISAPGGSGKTVIFSEFCRIVLSKWPKQKILILSDDQEILSQNHKTISEQIPDREIGLYSSGLRSKTIKNITVAGIQSIYNKVDLFKDFNLIIVDEAHKVGNRAKSRYRTFLDKIKKPTIGFTATPFRNVTGYLHLAENAYFTDIIYTIRIKELQEQNPPRLCRITSKQPGITLDASQIKQQAGDFIIKELSLAFDREGITSEIIKDLYAYKDVRKKWLVYAIDIEHCEHICSKLNEVGIRSRVVHSQTGIDRNSIISNFRESNQYQALVSVAMLTTGVDIPEVDLIALLRSTASAPLHCQIILRGMRVSSKKEDCLVLDYAGNLLRNGPIDAPVIVVKGTGGGGEAIMKVCDNCQEIVHIACRTCPSCLHPFTFKHHLTMKSGTQSVVSENNWFTVDKMEYSWYMSGRGIPMLKATHICGIRRFDKLVAIEHGGRATYMAKHWWNRRADIEMPKTARLAALTADVALATPRRILVNESGKYIDIKDSEF